MEERKEEEDEAKDLSMHLMHQKGLGKRDNGEGRGGVAGSGRQGSGGSTDKQPTSTKS